MREYLQVESLSGQEMGGRMSCVGFTWKAVPGAKAAPFKDVIDHLERHVLSQRFQVALGRWAVMRRIGTGRLTRARASVRR